MSLKMVIKESLKMLLQHTVLPAVYFNGRTADIKKGLVVFADSHNDHIPFSMQKMYSEVKKLGGYTVKVKCKDISKLGALGSAKWAISFMRLYSRAEYVFICDNFLPVSSCKKRKGTTVVQLWHSGGLLKKSGYDQPYSVPQYYKGNVFANYSLLTVSAPCCEPVFTRMMRQPEGVVKALGTSRSDMFFNEGFLEKCRREFYDAYPEAAGKKIVLYAPTFRGSASEPAVIGRAAVKAAFEGRDDYFLVEKLHPHFESKNTKDISCDIPSERLLAAADVLVTDYSSILFDYCLLEKPFIIFAPDYDEYKNTVGFYEDIYSFPTTVAKKGEEIIPAIENELKHRSALSLKAFKQHHMGSCDGSSTNRILEYINMK